jgi:hypothetical protein
MKEAGTGSGFTWIKFQESLLDHLSPSFKRRQAK